MARRPQCDRKGSARRDKRQANTSTACAPGRPACLAGRYPVGPISSCKGRSNPQDAESQLMRVLRMRYYTEGQPDQATRGYLRHDEKPPSPRMAANLIYATLMSPSQA